MRTVKVLLGASSLALLGIVALVADGTEQLGPASIPIAAGTGMVSAGTGMNVQPSQITVEVPEGATVNQVVLYWEGFMAEDVAGDDTIVVSGNSVTGALIGGPAYFFDGAYASAFRADITNLGLVEAGVNVLNVSGLEFTNVSNGAGVMVIFSDGSSSAQIQIRDGVDLAFVNFPEPRQSTVAQTFSFAPTSKDRIGQLNMFFASVSGTVSGFGKRPTSIEVTTLPGGVTQVFSNLLDSISGQEWDNFVIAVTLPAGTNGVRVQAFSRDDGAPPISGGLPASFDWLAAGFAIEPETPPGVPGRMTGGGSVFTIGDVRVTRGFQIHCDLREPNNLEVNWPDNKFHTLALTGAVCTDDPAINQNPPAAPFDTFTGEGVGRLNNKPGGRIEFVFVDAGEPGINDTASMKIYDADGNLVLDVTGDPNVPGFLDHGNIQAHKDNPPKGK
jgi:hypothetical protein